MPTVTSLDLVEHLLKHNGYYYDDPPVTRITRYTSLNGETCFGLDYGWEWNYSSSEYVLKPEIIWELHHEPR